MTTITNERISVYPEQGDEVDVKGRFVSIGTRYRASADVVVNARNITAIWWGWRASDGQILIQRQASASEQVLVLSLDHPDLPAKIVIHRPDYENKLQAKIETAMRDAAPILGEILATMPKERREQVLVLLELIHQEVG